MLKLAVIANEKDNVATAVNYIKKGQEVVIDASGSEMKVVLNEDIQFGHKFAVKYIKKDEQIIKYGESIGFATADINMGDYVHVHNIESGRGRGDLGVSE